METEKSLEQGNSDRIEDTSDRDQNDVADEFQLIEKKCAQCNETFDFLPDLLLHVERFHPNEKVLKCLKCRVKFDKLKSVRRHHKRYHKANFRHFCEFCLKSFEFISGLKRHLVVHTGERPFTCSFCENCYQSKYDLLRHQKKFHLEQAQNTAEDNENIDFSQKDSTNIVHKDCCDHNEIIENTVKDEPCIIDHSCNTCDKNDQHAEQTTQLTGCLDANEEFYSDTDSSDDNLQVKNLIEISKVEYISDEETVNAAKPLHDICRSIENQQALGIKETPKTKSSIKVRFKHNCPKCNKVFNFQRDLVNHGRRFHSSINAFNMLFKSTNLRLANINDIPKSKSRYQTSLQLLRCKLCSKSFKNSYELNCHLKVHNEEKPSPLFCPVCKETFEQKSSLKAHQEICQSKGLPNKYKCEFCSKIFKFRSFWKQHIRRINERCWVCLKTFKNTCLWTKHRELHRTNETYKYKCGICTKAFKEAPNLRVHLKSHSDYRPYSCSVCDTSYKHKADLKRHLRSFKHKSMLQFKPKFECEYCSASFTYIIDLNRHMKMHPAETKLKYIHVCSLCERRFENEHHLIYHEKQEHSGKYRCHLCKRGFICNEILTKHVANNICNNKKAVCEFCFQRFSNNSGLRPHLGVHIGQRAFPCFLCNKSFEFKYQLKRHQEIHISSNFEGNNDSDFQNDQHKEQTAQLTECFDTNEEYFSETDSSDDLQVKNLIEISKIEYISNEEIVNAAKPLQDICRSNENQQTLVVKENPKTKRSIKVRIKHTCPKCNKVFNFQRDLENHGRRFHSSIKAFKSSNFRLANINDVPKSKCRYQTSLQLSRCKLCSKSFNSSYELNCHLKVHNEEEPPPFKQKSSFSAHQKLCRSKDLPYKHNCEICSKNFKYKYLLRNHLEAHRRKETKHRCRICTKTFRQARHLSAHLKIHSDNRPYSCSVCDMSFKHQSTLKGHLQTSRHRSMLQFKPKYDCEYCSASFTYIIDLNRHMKMHPAETKLKYIHVCSLCERRFENEHRLIYHEKQEHSGKYRCHLCKRGFICNEILTKHVANNICNNKKAVCEFCFQRFSNNSVLRPHLGVHIGQRAFPCFLCNKSFEFKYQLKRHQEIHISSDFEGNNDSDNDSDFQKDQHKEQTAQLTECFDTNEEYCSEIDSSDDLQVKNLIEISKIEYICNEEIVNAAKPSQDICRSNENQQTLGIKENPKTKRSINVRIKHTCPKCNKVFNFQRDLVNHGRRFHSGIKAFKSSNLRLANINDVPKSKSRYQTSLQFSRYKLCSKSFNNSYELNCHLKVHNAEEEPPPFKQKSSLRAHQELCQFKDLPNRYKCEICSKTFKYKCLLRKHHEAHRRKETKHKCGICTKAFKRARLLSNHLKIHSDNRPYSCSVCSVSFKHQSSLKGHLQTSKHRTMLQFKPKYDCEYCTASFIYIIDLNRHMKMHPAETKFKYVCSLCERRFENEHGLKNHENLEHSGKYRCHFCKEGFMCKEIFKKHVANNICINKNAVCEFCFERFSTNVLLKKHLAAHFGKRAFPCSLCKESFEFKYQLKRHQEIHISSNFEGYNDSDFQNDQHKEQTAQLTECFDINEEYFCETDSSDDLQVKNLIEISKIEYISNEEIVNAAKPLKDICRSNENQQTLSIKENPKTKRSIKVRIKHTCPKCNKVFNFQRDLVNHGRRFHSGIKAFKSSNLRLANINDVSKSKSRYQASLQFVRCKLCSKSFNNSYELNCHLKEHIEEEPPPLFCPVCKETFEQKSSLSAHQELCLSKDLPNKYNCEFCSKTFKYKYLWRNHHQAHRKKETKHKCGLCTKTFRRAAFLSAHLKTHSDNRPYSCSVCDMSFKHRSTLRGHLQTFRHRSMLQFKPKYDCEYCSASFTYIIDLNLHMKMHPAETKLKYVCSLCERRFENEHRLKNHENLEHSGKYRCHFCKEGFMRKEALENHLAKNICVNKKAVCEFCFERFSNNFLLKKHLGAHIGQRAFPCSLCKESFEFQYQLKLHQEIHISSNFEGNNDSDFQNDQNKEQTAQLPGSFDRNEEFNGDTDSSDALQVKNLIAISKIDNISNEEIMNATKPLQDICLSNENLQTLGVKETHKVESNRKVKFKHKCPKCNKIFNYQRDLVKHVQQYHRNAKSFKIIGYRARFLKTKSPILSGTSSDEKSSNKHYCRFCSESFKDRTQLNIHLRELHSEENNSLCNTKNTEVINVNENSEDNFNAMGTKYATKSFAKFPNTQHRRKMAVISDNKCWVCFKKFNFQRDLIRHVQQFRHRNKMAFKCRNCSAKFVKISALNKHRKSIHGS